MRRLFQSCFVAAARVSNRFHRRGRPVHILNWSDRRAATNSPATPPMRSTRMNTITPINAATATPHAIVDTARELGPIFGQRASEATNEDAFVADNFALLKSAGLV